MRFTPPFLAVENSVAKGSESLGAVAANPSAASAVRWQQAVGRARGRLSITAVAAVCRSTLPSSASLRGPKGRGGGRVGCDGISGHLVATL